MFSVVTKKIAHERLTALVFRDECIVTACQVKNHFVRHKHRLLTGNSRMVTCAHGRDQAVALELLGTASEESWSRHHMLPARKVHLLCVVNVPWPVTSRGLTSGSIYTFVCDTHTMWPRRTWWAAVIWEIPEDTTREPLFEACCWKHSEEGITLVCKALLNTSSVKSKDKLSLSRSET